MNNNYVGIISSHPVEEGTLDFRYSHISTIILRLLWHLVYIVQKKGIFFTA